MSTQASAGKISDDAKETSKPEKASGFHDLTEVLVNTFAVLESPPDPHHPLSYLKSINLKGDLTAEDHKLDMEFLFDEIDFAFSSLKDQLYQKVKEVHIKRYPYNNFLY